MAVVTAKGVSVHDARRQVGRAQADARDLGSDLGGEGRLQALHAQGNLRAAAAVRETVLGRASLETGQVHLNEMAISDADLKCDRQDHAARLRHVLARRAGRQVHDRGAREAAGRSRLRLGVPLSQSDHQRRRRWRSPSRSRAKPPTRSRRCAKRKARARAASRSATSSAAWPRAKPRARSTRTPARKSASRRPRRSRRSSSRSICFALKLAEVRGTLSRSRTLRAHHGADAAAAGPRRHAQDREGRSRRSPRSSTTARTSCISAAASTIRSRSKAR